MSETSWWRRATIGTPDVRVVSWLVILAACASDKPPESQPSNPTPTEETPTPTPTSTPVVEETAQPTPEPLEPPSLDGAFVEVVGTTWDDGGWQPPRLQGYSRTWWLAGDLDGVDGLELYAGEVNHPTMPGWGQVFRLVNGTFEHDPALSSEFHNVRGGVIGIFDLDGDGDDDVVRADSNVMAQLQDPAGWINVPFITPEGVVPELRGLNAIAPMDFDQDGWLDLVYAPDGCHADMPHSVLPMIRVAERTWQPMRQLVPQDPPGDAFAIMTAPLGAGEPHIWMIGRECSLAEPPTGFARFGARNAEGYPVYDEVDVTPEDSLYRLDPTAAGRPITLRQPMGSAVVDLDLDGHLDMVATLSDPLVHLFYGTGGPVMEDRSAEILLELPHGDAGKAKLPWGVAPLDADADGRPDLLVLEGNDAATKTEVPYNGPYFSSLFWNDGEGDFAAVDAGFDLDGDWHSVVVFDLDGDIDPDLGIGSYGFMPRIYRNDTALGRHVAFRLVGTTSNHLGFGAKVHVSAAGLPDQLRVVGEIGAPHVVSRPDLYFGVADADLVDVRIEWPSGVQQRVDGLAVGQRHTMEEPAVITLSEADRHLPADGVAAVTITVEPRDDRGALRDADVAIEQPWGEGAWLGPAVRDGQRYSRVLVSPTSAGSSVIEVRIDGTAVTVRPRVWWD